MNGTASIRSVVFRVPLLVALVTAVIVAFVSTSSVDAQPRDLAIPDRWVSVLEALEPTNPIAYFEVAEDVADAAQTDAERQLARRLFVLAADLDPPALAASACLALADLDDTPGHRRRLLTFASLLDPGRLDAPWRRDHGDLIAKAPDDATLLALTEALSAYRRGRGDDALKSLERHDARALLKRYESLLRGGLPRFIEDCRLYRGRLRPSLSDRDLTRLLDFEIALLAGRDRSWAGDLLLHQGAPLVEADPARLIDLSRIDPRLTIYRNRRWIAPPGSESP